MGKRHGFNKNNDDDLWRELADRLVEVNTENVSEVDLTLMKSANATKELFDAYVTSGFSGEQAIRLLAEIMVRSGRK